MGENDTFGLTAEQRRSGIVRRRGQPGLMEACAAMAKTKQKISGDFDAILAGLDQQPAEEPHGYRTRRKTPEVGQRGNAARQKTPSAAC